MDEPTLPTWFDWVSLSVLALVLLAWGQLIKRLWTGTPLLHRRRQRRVPWGLDGAALACLFLLVALAAFVSSFFSDEIVDRPAVEVGYEVVIAQLSTLLLFAAITIVWLVNRYRSHPITRADFGLGGPDKQQVSDVGLGVVATAAMLPLVYAANYGLMLIFGKPTPHPAIKELIANPTVETIVSTALLAVISAPLFEELAFRVLLQGGLQRWARRNAWWPILVSSLAFGASHTNQGYSMVSIFVLALGLGYVYRQTHSYPAVVAMHMAFNGLSLATAVAAGQGGIEL